MSKLILRLPLLLVFLTPPSAAAQTGSNEGVQDTLTIKLAVVGPGDALFLSWGHIGIIVEDSLSGTSRFFDYGVFSFEEEDFFVNFAFGRLNFLVGSYPVKWNLTKAVEDDREVVLMTLNLPGKSKEEMKALLEKNALPENRHYLYDHYWNNCATKVRDILDQFTDGQIRQITANIPGRMTLRDHTRRHLGERPFFDWFLPFLMGPVIDTPITLWDELFLPSEFLRVFRNFTYRDESGMEVALVSEIENYHYAKSREIIPGDPPSPNLWLFLVGLILAVVAWAGRRLYPGLGGRFLLGTFNLGMGIFAGGIGFLLFFMTFFTDHHVTHSNLNLLFINPLLLALIPLGIRVLRGSEGGRFSPLFGLRLVWTILASAALLALILGLLPVFIQKNGITLALFLPCALSMSYYPLWIKALFRGIGAP